MEPFNLIQISTECYDKALSKWATIYGQHSKNFFEKKENVEKAVEVSFNFTSFYLYILVPSYLLIGLPYRLLLLIILRTQF